MSLQFYHYLHLIGLILVFIGIGGLLSSEGAKKAMIWHGLGLFISLVSAFGMLSKMSKGQPEGSPSLYTQHWVIAKIVLWLVLGCLPVLAKRRVIATPLIVFIAAMAGAALAGLGYFKPQF